MDEDSVVMRFKMEGEIDKKQIKQEMDSAQKIADSSKITIPTKTEEVKTKDVKQEVKAVQKKVNKEAVELPVELPDDFKKLMKQYKAEIKSLSQLKKVPSKEKTQKLLNYDKQYAKIRKKYKDNDEVKKFDAFLDSSEMPKIRIQAKKTAEAQEKALKEQEKIANEQIKDAKQQKSKSSKTDAQTKLKEEKQQKNKSSKTDTQTKLKEEKQKIIDTVNEARKQVDTARENVSRSQFRANQDRQAVEGWDDEKGKTPYAKSLKATIDSAKTYFENNKHLKSIFSTTEELESYQKTVNDLQKVYDGITQAYENREKLTSDARKELNKALTKLKIEEQKYIERFTELKSILDEPKQLLLDENKKYVKQYSDFFKQTAIKLPEMVKRSGVDKFLDKQFYKDLYKGAGRGKAGTPGADINLSHRMSNMDITSPLTDTLRATNKYGTYVGQNDLMRSTARNVKKYWKANKESLEIFRGAKAKEKAKNSKKATYAPQTEEEKAKEKANITSNMLAYEQGGVIHKRDDTSVETMKDLANLVISTYENAGLSKLDAMNLTIAKLFNRHSNNTALGMTEAEDNEILGEGPGIEEANRARKEILDTFDDYATNDELIAIQSELKNTAKISTQAYESALKKYAPYLVENFPEKFGNLRYLIDNKNKKPYGQNSTFAKDLAKSRQTLKDIGSKLDKQNTLQAVSNIDNSQIGKEQISIAETDANDGLNAQSNADNLIQSQGSTEKTTEQIKDILGDMSNGIGDGNGSKNNNFSYKGKLPYLPILQRIATTLETITNILVNISSIKSQLPEFLWDSQTGTIEELKALKEEQKKIEKVTKDTSTVQQIKTETEQTKIKKSKFVDKSEDVSRNKRNISVLDKIKNILIKISKPSFADQLLSMDEAKIEKIREKRLEQGLPRNERDVTSIGDKLGAMRTKFIYGWGKSKGADPFENLKNVNLTKGIKFDSQELTKAFQKMIEKNMFNAQTGGILRNIVGSMTGYIGMPSIEKSRAQAEGLNQIMADLRDKAQTILQAIQTDETDLRALQKAGKGDSEDAKFLTARIEDRKKALQGIVVESGYANKLIEKYDYNVSKVLKHLGFVTPELREENKIISNLNAGLDKNGKALKFQSRTAEILNYSFQLMSRSIGQMYKNWMVQLNPLTQIKKLFNDFMGYNVKWQRTMNVVKYNMRSIFRPFMEWIAQQLVNIIGFFDIISMKVQKAFGRLPVSVFDQAAADSEKINEELEAASSVSAGFDELHDIGGDNTGANDLFGEIYKPQLSKEWEDLANKIGDLFAGIITGDLGFSEVMLKILDIAWSGLKTIAGYVGKFLKDNIWPLIKNNWLEILAWVGGAFLAWKFLKTAGSLLVNAIFGKLTPGIVSNMLSNIGTLITSGFSKIWNGLTNLPVIGQFFTQLQLGFQQMLYGKGLIGAIKTGGTTLGSVFAQAFTAVLGASLWNLTTGYFTDKATDNAIYNKMLTDTGGNEKDKKSNILNVLGSGLGGAATGALTGASLGGLPGAVIGGAIGGIAGILRTVLVPAAEAAKVSIDDMNNSLQNTSYYEGAIIGFKTQISDLETVIGLLNTKLDTNKQTVIQEGLELGITKERMNELITSVEKGTYSSNMLTGEEIKLTDSLNSLADVQSKVTDKTEKLEAAKIKLQKAETDLAILTDLEAGKFEIAAARIEVAETSGVYTAEEAMKKRKQAYAIGGEECREALLSMADSDMQSELDKNLNEVDKLIQEHQGFWQKAGDTIKEIFTFGKADTWTYNGGVKAESVLRVQKQAAGTNYVEADGLTFLHQGEAVIPKKFNQPYKPQGSMTAEELAYMQKMMTTLSSLDNTMKQGIPVSGQFVQRGSDLVAVVNKTKSQSGADLLSNVSYAR